MKDSHTEKQLLETAMRVFFTEGRIYATTQEIADAAGVNRTLINYYFRSKKALLLTAVKEAQKKLRRDADKVLSANLPFREKTEMFVEIFLNNQSKYPYLESYITTGIIKQGIDKRMRNFNDKRTAPIRQFLNEVEKEMEKGNIQKCNPVHFMMNLFSLMIYPVIMKPLQMGVYNLSETEYDQILNQRKKIILDLLVPPKE